jgi:anti-anti-sigma factor
MGSAVHPRPASPSPDAHPRSLLVSVDLRAGRVQVTGDLDRGCAHHLLDGLAALGLTGHPTWTVDAAAVSFCDASGLRALARGRTLAASRGRVLQLVGAPPFLARLLTLAGLGALLAPPPAPGTGPAPVRGRGGPAGRWRLRGQALRCSTKS